MIIRFLLVFFVIICAGILGQPGFFGPVSVRLRAGDLAPHIFFDNILHAAGSAPWSSANLSGKVTVLVFFPDTSHNLQAVSKWNALVEQFAGKPVQFVWITAEKESSLMPWLSEHPVAGWMFHDPGGQTGSAYGLEMPAAVFIGADRRIVGFDGPFVPEAREVDAVLTNRITTAEIKPERAAIKAFFESGLVRLAAESPRMPRADDHKPDFPPSYTLHVSPAKDEVGGGDYNGIDFLNAKGFDLKALIEKLYSVSRIRIDLPASLDDGKRYDFAMVLPEPEDREKIYDRARQGIQDHFHIIMTRENRMRDVYVVTALNARPPAARVRPGRPDGLITDSSSGSIEFQVVRVAGSPDEFSGPPDQVSIGDIRGISLVGTLDDFCKTLERTVDRPVIDETNLMGEFEFQVKASEATKNDFLDRLRDQLGLVITPARRNAETLVFKAR